MNACPFGKKGIFVKTYIITCGSLRKQVAAAQNKEGTHYPVVELDRRLHAEPVKMREALFDAMYDLPGDTDLVLISMGMCGGSLLGKEFRFRTVIPRVDDCISLQLHTAERNGFNLKEKNHLYLTDMEDGCLSIEKIHEQLIERHGEKQGKETFARWFDGYRHVDIVDSGFTGCHSPEYREAAERNAAMIQAEISYVDGSNIILEELVSGRWDEHFLIVDKGTVLEKRDFCTVETS